MDSYFKLIAYINGSQLDRNLIKIKYKNEYANFKTALVPLWSAAIPHKVTIKAQL